MISDFLEIPGRRPRLTIAAICLLFITAYGVAAATRRAPGGRLLFGDAVHYYVYLRSMTFDRDLRFQNEYMALYRLRSAAEGPDWLTIPTETGHVRNYMAIGPALYWAPLYLLVCAGARMGQILGGNYTFDGFEPVFQASVAASGIVCAAVGAWRAFWCARLFFGSELAIWSVLAIWFGTSAIYYSLVSPAYSHAVSMLIVSALWLEWARRRGERRAQRYVRFGLLAGLAALVRWQDGIFIVLPFVELVVGRIRERGSARPRLPDFAIAAAVTSSCALLAFTPQLVAWRILYGHWLLVPQGSGFMNWRHPELWNVLFSQWHGLISWTPLVAIALAGLPLLYRRDRILGAAAVVTLVAAWYVNAAVADWWAGEAFGARRFVSCFPVFVLLLAAVFERLRDWPIPVAAFVVLGPPIFNVLLLLQYELFMHGFPGVPYPGGWYGLWLARFVTPLQLVGRLMS
ncbi:MAG: hypothetical protein HYX76_07995 [Acidobacteria bacterium]|nr:hypothetical protein [Acidobacteriota bacterium]